MKKQEANKETKLTPASAILLYALFYYEATGEISSLFVANKLAYFLKRLGEKSLNKLKFEASHYGPYSTGVEHMLQRMNGKYLKGLEQMNAKAFEYLDLQYTTATEVSEYIQKELTPEQRERLKNLTKLIDGFQSALSLEVLATVDFVSKENPGIDPADIIQKIHDWSDRKKRLFQNKYIHIAIEHLNDYSRGLI